MNYKLCILLLMRLVLISRAFPQGAPADACDSLLPRHVGTKPSDLSKSPYYLVQSTNIYEEDYAKQGKGIKVELGGASFKGFFIIALDPLTGHRIGEWIKFKGTDVLPCSATTHSNSKSKRLASLIWIPPVGQRGYVAFEATIVRSFGEYYSGLVSVLPHQLKIREQQKPAEVERNNLDEQRKQLTAL